MYMVFHFELNLWMLLIQYIIGPFQPCKFDIKEVGLCTLRILQSNDCDVSCWCYSFCTVYRLVTVTTDICTVYRLVTVTTAIFLDVWWSNATEYFLTTQFLLCAIIVMTVTKYIFVKKLFHLDISIFNSDLRKWDSPDCYNKLCQYIGTKMIIFLRFVMLPHILIWLFQVW